MNSVYEPAQDSYLLEKFVKKYAKGLVLDMGCGSGILAKSAIQKADFIIGLDINKDAIKYCKKNIKNKNILFLKSNLFEIFSDNFFFYDEIDNKINIFSKKKVKYKEEKQTLVKKQIKFDLIVFNPPYLPQELKERDKALEGGKKGYEVIQKFLEDVSKYLKSDGKILLLFSSFSNKGKIIDLIKKNNLKYVELAKEHIFFEDLYVYYIAK